MKAKGQHMTKKYTELELHPSHVGCSRENVIQVMTELGVLEQWGEFISGQTGAIADDGTFLYYPYDIIRFLQGRASVFNKVAKKLEAKI